MLTKKQLCVLLFTLVSVISIAISPCYAVLYVTESDQTFGFQNGSYLGFEDDHAFLTEADGGSTYQESSTNATYPDFRFFQEQGSTAVYGFHASGCSITVTAYFESSMLEFTTDGAGTVKVYVGSLAAPTSVTGATGTFSATTNIETLTVPLGTVQLHFGSSTGIEGGGTLPEAGEGEQPLGSRDFRVSDLNVGNFAPNMTVTATLHFRYTGSSYTLWALNFSEPWQSWFNEEKFQHKVFALSAFNESSADYSVEFIIPSYIALQDYSGTITAVGMDAFSTFHTSTAQITGSAVEHVEPDWLFYLRSNPLVMAGIVVGVVAFLSMIVLVSRRRKYA